MCHRHRRREALLLKLWSCNPLYSRSKAQQRRKLRVGVDIPKPAEVRAIAGKLEGRWRPLILTALFTGLRASELRGLRWEDVDLDGPVSGRCP
jgi:integrase